MFDELLELVGDAGWPLLNKLDEAVGERLCDAGARQSDQPGSATGVRVHDLEERVARLEEGLFATTKMLRLIGRFWADSPLPTNPA